MKRTYTKAEIKAKLKWFHGADFEKYPFIEEDNDNRTFSSNVKQ